MKRDATTASAPPPTEHTPMLHPRPAPVSVDTLQTREECDAMPFWQRVSSPLHPVFLTMQDHCHYEWVAVLLSTVSLVLLFVFVFYYNTPPVPMNCVTSFGQFLGESNGVLAFSNCNRGYENVEEHFVLVKTSRVYSGVKWKATEYARRFWLLTKRPGVEFVSVNNAEEIWTSVEEASYIGGKRAKLIKIPNILGGSDKLNISKAIKKSQWEYSRPRVGDLLVYASDDNLPGGHVAVIVDIAHQSNSSGNRGTPGRHYVIYLAEQNWDNKQWVDVGAAAQGGMSSSGTPVPRHYSRTVLLHEEEATRTMGVHDVEGTVLGWVRV
ncbi:D-alanyl-glycyl endopeptidase-like protein [Trypanosoma grayi]|uniref:D-alanyl-glycyl endopeptidase-like protein n=1 Tax=Trypanosoma grayi TaxID=71804 RepID=UPI0004F48DC0|nr:D-alanyl-glycyl endopeptidase-like protein [Trypanosoma grayi]KEG10650.1 D-alanyl-glycyl endopeptidase-like protein [Trypanosoma grayi]